jgi:putative transposase
VELPLTISPIDAVRRLKSISAKIIFALIPNLRLRYPQGALWSTGKFAISVGTITLEKAKEYVKNQGTHHAKSTIDWNPRPTAVGSARRLRACPEEEVKK